MITSQCLHWLPLLYALDRIFTIRFNRHIWLEGKNLEIIFEETMKFKLLPVRF